jgi:erythromycin esterase-like protein
MEFINRKHAGRLLEKELDEFANRSDVIVIYRPETERASHYFKARLSAQFDAVIHFDETRAVEPLEVTAEWKTGEVPETFPTGI